MEETIFKKAVNHCMGQAHSRTD